MKKHLNCKFFGYRSQCLHGNDELMAQFLRDIEVPQSSSPVELDMSKSEMVDERLCLSCTKFESNKS